ncbi:hypothetical protein SAY86_016068 [Trapa natans]|uniref:DUF4378 domain-containing protein n=1 Tax=Trapa natans TaxID=22666 RepID=A0AAN7QZ39_TRANT|nr:hypothetical protein SAY86_016068 [Trapa natans]
MMLPSDQQGSQQNGGLSMALALALENGGNLRQFSSSGRSFLALLPKIARSDLQSPGNHSRTPSITHLYIQEISKGAQKLNQVLRGCSNGFNFDKYPVEIGKELFTRATDLQQVLINFQEPSDSMVKPWWKTRIVLLGDGEEVGEDEPAERIEQKQLHLLPRFSFDKPTRTRYPRKQQSLPDLFYTPERTLDSITAVQEKKRASSCQNGKVGKGRMSSVIAKLMGLEEVPASIDSEKGQTKITDLKAKENVGPAVVSAVKADTTKPGKTNHVSPCETLNFIWKAQKNRDPHSSRNVAVEFQERIPLKNPESIKAIMAVDRGFVNPSKKRHEKQNSVQNKQTGKRTEETQTRVPLQKKVEPKKRKIQAGKRDQKTAGNDVRSGPSYGTRSLEIPKENQQESVKETTRQKKGNERVSRASAQRVHPVNEEPKLKKYLQDEANYTHKSKGVVRGRQAPKEFHEVAKINSMKEADGTALEDLAKSLPHRSASGEVKVIAPPKKLDLEESQHVTPMATLEPEDPGQNILLSSVEDDQQIHEQLTESETQLKSILSKSRLFLDTSEALFKLNIPIGSLEATDEDFTRGDEYNRLALDCAFEIMKRTGRIRELAFHPFAWKARTSFTNNNADFDSVIRKLFKDFEGLRTHGREGPHDSEVEDYLPRMLELDIHMRNPETDCMWDSGWDTRMFVLLEKDEVVKDVERLMMYSLIDEMARDIQLHM